MKKVFGVLAFLSFFYLLGVVGAVEQDTMTLGAGMVRMGKRDNCKNCVSRCEHAGKDREFIYSGEKSCKVLYTPERVTKAAADFVGAIKLIATKPDNLDNLESYLSHHFPEWVSRWANSPEDLAAEMKEFARMEI